MELSTQILGQSVAFADGLEQFNYINPKYDYTIQSPQGNDVQLHNMMNNQQKDSIISASAKQNAILFFFRSDCPYCHKYAPIVKEFAADYGFQETISLDGRGLPNT
jgi:conjugal transfer pilus assembly protein TraF